MNIRNYSDLTNFVFDEYSKMQDNFGTKRPSEDFLIQNEKMLMRYVKLYSRPLYKKQKRELELMNAIDTMPHGWIWKIFHPSLWAKIQEGEKQKKEYLETAKAETTETNNVHVTVPIVLPKNEYPDIYND